MRRGRPTAKEMPLRWHVPMMTGAVLVGVGCSEWGNPPVGWVLLGLGLVITAIMTWLWWNEPSSR